jgi:hypothetical protein
MSFGSSRLLCFLRYRENAEAASETEEYESGELVEHSEEAEEEFHSEGSTQGSSSITSNVSGLEEDTSEEDVEDTPGGGSDPL